MFYVLLAVAAVAFFAFMSDRLSTRIVGDPKLPRAKRERDSSEDDPSLPLDEALRRWTRRSDSTRPSDPLIARLIAQGPASIAAVMDAVRSHGDLAEDAKLVIISVMDGLGGEGVRAFAAEVARSSVEEEARMLEVLQDAASGVEDSASLAAALCAAADARTAADLGEVASALEEQGLTACAKAIAEPGANLPVQLLVLRATVEEVGQEVALTALAHPDPRVRAAMAQSGSVQLDAPELARAAQDPDEAVRYALARTQATSSSELRQALASLLRDPSGRVRAAAAIWLGLDEPTAAEREAIHALSADGDPRVQFALAVLADDEATSDRLREAIEGEDAGLRDLAVAASFAMSDDGALQALDALLLLGSPSEVVELFYRRLASGGDALPTRLAALALSDVVPGIRRAALAELMRHEDEPAAVEAIERVLAREAPARTRRAAFEALLELEKTVARYAEKLLVPDEPLLDDVLHALDVLYIDDSPEVRQLVENLVASEDPRLVEYGRDQRKSLEKKKKG